MTGGPCVVMLPGLLCDDAVWAAQCEALGPARCIVPSYGALDSIGGMARHVLDLVPAARFSLVGHSMGGRVALEIALLAPERLERLALLDTGVQPIAEGAHGERERTQRAALLCLARQSGMRAMGRQWARGMVHPSRVDSPLFDQILDMIERKTGFVGPGAGRGPAESRKRRARDGGGCHPSLLMPALTGRAPGLAKALPGRGRGKAIGHPRRGLRFSV